MSSTRFVKTADSCLTFRWISPRMSNAITASKLERSTLKPVFASKTTSLIAPKTPEMAQGLVCDIEHIGIAQKVYQWAKRFGIKPLAKNGMSQIDLVQRIMLPVGLYVPQQIGAAITGQHVWETLGRNTIGWVLQFMGTIGIKNADGNVVSFLNHFMTPQKKLAPDASWQEKLLHPLINPLRPKVNFQDILVKAGLKPNTKPGFWAEYDNNEISTLLLMQEKLKAKAKASLPKDVLDSYYARPKHRRPKFLDKALLQYESTALSAKERLLLHEIPRFVGTRRLIMNLLKTGGMMFLNIFIVGFVAMWITYKSTARWDKDFEPNSPRQKPPTKPGAEARHMASASNTSVLPSMSHQIVNQSRFQTSLPVASPYLSPYLSPQTTFSANQPLLQRALLTEPPTNVYSPSVTTPWVSASAPFLNGLY